MNQGRRRLNRGSTTDSLTDPGPGTDSDPDMAITHASLTAQMLAESRAMARHALAGGVSVPSAVIEAIDSFAFDPDPAVRSPEVVEATRRLTTAYQQLVMLVAPATPRTLLLLESERANMGYWSFLGPVRLVRFMMSAAVFFLVVFIFTALSPAVNSMSGDIFQSSGTTLLVNEVFLLSAAGVGAAFAALFKANRYIANGTYDPMYESSYWVRFTLGLIAGIILASLVPVSKGSTISRPLLSLLGGFSAAVVYRILARLVNAVESIVRDGPDSATGAVSSAVLQARLSDQDAQQRLRLSTTALALRDQLRAGASRQEIEDSLSGLLENMLSPATLGDAPAANGTATPVGATGEAEQPAPTVAGVAAPEHAPPVTTDDPSLTAALPASEN